MKYNPKAAVACLAANVYDASIDKMEAGTTKKGDKDMVTATLRLYTDLGERTIKEWIVMPDFAWKLKRIAKAIGKLAAFDSGEFDPRDYEGEVLAVELVVEESEEYGDQNRIKAFLPKRVGSRPVDAPAPASTRPKPVASDAAVEIQEDDIPFLAARAQ